MIPPTICFRSLSFASIFLSAALLPVAAWAEEGVPAWAKGERAAITLKRGAQPSYLEVKQTASVLRPKALTDFNALEKLNPGLDKTLPALRAMVEKATVSSRFSALYDAKMKAIAGGDVMPANYYFDCATVLNAEHVKSGRSVVVLQADMDTDTDGSDPVRMGQLKDYNDARVSLSFQPLLAYSWGKSDDATPSPFPKYYEDTLGRLRLLQGQINDIGKTDISPMWREINETVTDEITKLDKRAKYYHADLQSRRSLIASVDPFIVLPQTWMGSDIKIGDLVAVIYEGKVLPCLIGDTGPNAKVGEASQRLARALNPKASGVVSAVTSASVTYLVFPGTAQTKAVPEPDLLEIAVGKLLNEIGGLGPQIKLYSWKQTTPSTAP